MVEVETPASEGTRRRRQMVRFVSVTTGENLAATNLAKSLAQSLSEAPEEPPEAPPEQAEQEHEQDEEDTE